MTDDCVAVWLITMSTLLNIRIDTAWTHPPTHPLHPSACNVPMRPRLTAAHGRAAVLPVRSPASSGQQRRQGHHAVASGMGIRNRCSRHKVRTTSSFCTATIAQTVADLVHNTSLRRIRQVLVFSGQGAPRRPLEAVPAVRRLRNGSDHAPAILSGKQRSGLCSANSERCCFKGCDGLPRDSVILADSVQACSAVYV